jgi:hypothetical protein
MVHFDLVVSVPQVLLLGPGADWKLPAQLVFAQQVDVEVTVIPEPDFVNNQRAQESIPRKFRQAM